MAEEFSKNQRQPGIEQRSLLGGALSIEFSDCSIAAADLSKQAGELMQAQLDDKSYYSNNIFDKYIIGDGDTPQRVLQTKLGRVVIAQPVEAVADPDTSVMTKTRSWLISRNVETKSTQNVLRGDPMLAVQIGDDTLLPIASFARRRNGQCSYVQLGQEMYDDNFYVTAADDESTRHGLIEAMRRIVKGGYGDDREWTQASGVIKKFVDQQLALRHEPVAQAYERQLVRQLFAKVKNDNSKKRQLTVIDDNGSSAPETYDTATIIPNTILTDDRQVSLVAARPSHPPDQPDADHLGLFAVTRDGIATQVATASSNFLRLEYETDVTLTPTQHEQVVRDLLFTIIARPDVKKIEVPELQYFDPTSYDVTTRQIRKYCNKKGYLSDYEGDRSSNHLGGQVSQNLNNFFMYPDREYNPYPGEAPLSLALSRLEVLSTNDRQVLAALKVDVRFGRLLGEARKCDEVLMCYIAKLAMDGGLQAELDDEQIGKTKAAAVVAAKVTVNDGLHELIISGRPASMPDEDLKPLIEFTVDQTKPYLGHEKSKLNGFSKSHVNEIIGILARLSVASKLQS